MVVLKALLCLYLLRICDASVIIPYGYSFGRSVKNAGDINKDGYNDILVGTHRDGAYVIYGNSTSSLKDIDLSLKTLDPASTGFALRGEVENGYFGGLLSTAGDVNGDGYDDIIIGAISEDDYRGAVYVIYGNATSSLKDINLASITLDPSTTGFKISGNAAYDYFGGSVSAAGDVNNDGYDDIIIVQGSYHVVYVIYGNATSSLMDIDFASTTLDPASTGFTFTMTRENDNDNWLSAVGTAGDVNGDGFSDLILGAHGKDEYRGVVYVVYGNTTSSLMNLDLASMTLDPASTGFTLRRNAKSYTFGRVVGTAGDVNGDGYDDINIGAYGEDDNRGAVYVVYGNSTSSLKDIDLNSTALDPYQTGFKITGNTAGDVFGMAVSSAEDVNGDGYDDVIVGAEGKDRSRGAVYIIYGNATSSLKDLPLASTPLDPSSTGFTLKGRRTNHRSPSYYDTDL